MNKNDAFKVLDEIYLIVNKRKKNKVKSSYTSKLFKQGHKKIAQKVVSDSDKDFWAIGEIKIKSANTVFNSQYETLDLEEVLLLLRFTSVECYVEL